MKVSNGSNLPVAVHLRERPEFGVDASFEVAADHGLGAAWAIKYRE
jgi:hypothetical protein